jgi:hypothetical protein
MSINLQKFIKEILAISLERNLMMPRVKVVSLRKIKQNFMELK